MKKFITAIILMSMLCSCSSVSQSEPETSRALTVTEEATTTTEPTTEPITTATEIPPATTVITEPPTEPEVNELLFNEQGIEIYYQGVDQNILNLHIVNSNEDLPVHVWIDNVRANDYSIEKNSGIGGYEGYAREGAVYDWGYVISLEELQSKNITRINDLKFDLYINLGDTQVAEVKDISIMR